MRGGKGSTLGSTGAYFTVSGSEVNTLRIRLEGTGTGISDVEAGKGGQTFDIYSLNASRCAAKPPLPTACPKASTSSTEKTYRKIKTGDTEMKKNIYTTPVVGIVKLDTTGIIATSKLGTGDRNDIEIKDEIFEGEFRSNRNHWEGLW